MILLCGIPSETALAMVAAALDARGADYTLMNQRHVREMAVELDVDGPDLRGHLTGPGFDLDLDEITAVYLRFMDDRWLPELTNEPAESAARLASRALHDIIGGWADISSALVVNRYTAMGSNFSKPFQAQLIRDHGFDVPATLVTNDPSQVLEFRDAHGPLIYKSISSERSVVHRLDEKELDRLERIRWCPVQFQAYIAGPNVRVHTVGERVFATRIETDATDYRYAVRQTGRAALFSAYELGTEISERCVRLARSLGLEVAGIDLKLAPDGRVVCLEVNPSPVFSYYELNTSQPIADAVAGLLLEGNGR